MSDWHLQHLIHPLITTFLALVKKWTRSVMTVVPPLLQCTCHVWPTSVLSELAGADVVVGMVVPMCVSQIQHLVGVWRTPQESGV